MKAWDKQKELARQRVPSQQQLLGKIQVVEPLRDRALAVFAYLTGGRVSEFVKEKYLRKVTYKKNEKGKLERDENKAPIVENIEKFEINYEGVCKGDISYSFLNDRRVMIVDIQNRKNKKKKRKQIPLLIERERAFVEILEEYLRQLEADEPLFNITKHRAYQILTEKTGFNCHYFRHMRATHLVTVHGFREHNLVMYMGWANLAPAQHYVHMRWQDIWS